MSELSSKRVHCMGAAGAGVLPLAICLRELGYDVTAEDDCMTDNARALLEGAGVSIDSESWQSEDDGIVVRTSAIDAGSPKIEAAVSRAWTVMRRGECLAEISKGRKLIAVVGSHGKTTTTGMLVELLEAAGASISYLLGGLFRGERAPAKVGESDWVVAEVDESDGTIEGFSPEVSLILNVDYDHHSQYPEKEDYLNAFRRIASRTRKTVIASREVVDVLGLTEGELKAELIVIGDEKGFLTEAKRIGAGVSRLALASREEELTLELNRSSEFNLSNASYAALAVKEVVGVEGMPRSVFFTQLARRQSCDYLSPKLS